MSTIFFNAVTYHSRSTLKLSIARPMAADRKSLYMETNLRVSTVATFSLNTRHRGDTLTCHQASNGLTKAVNLSPPYYDGD